MCGSDETIHSAYQRSQAWKSELGKADEGRPRCSYCVEEQVQNLGLNEQTCATSEKLRQWCQSNKDRCYIPEWLLKQWGIPVDPNVSG
jgi:hypothetical protein